MDIAGQTLPSPYYLSDDVQYYAPGPEFRLAREAAALDSRRREHDGARLRACEEVAAAVVLVVGVLLFELARRRFAPLWGRIQEEIETEIKRREARA